VDRCLNLAHLGRDGGIADIGHDCQPADAGDRLAQKFETLADGIGPLDRQAGDGSCRPVAPDPRRARANRGFPQSRTSPRPLIALGSGVCFATGSDSTAYW
jgi:hypothetical protein